jgi:hypothetical protein
VNVRLHDDLNEYVALTRLFLAPRRRVRLGSDRCTRRWLIDGRDMGSAVTAAAASWSLQAGAKHVVLNTDLSNPISNAIYPRIGFRPVYDGVVIAFSRPL